MSLDPMPAGEGPTDGLGRISVHLSRLPARLQGPARWLLENAPGRVGLRTATVLRRTEAFDRSMTLSAQFFTSMFPLMIIIAMFASRVQSEQIGSSIGLPPETQQVLNDAVSSKGFEAFGVLGLLLVLISATSLSRALARSFCAVWELPRPTASPRNWWRWIAVVVGLVVAVLMLRYLANFTEQLTPGPLWTVLLAGLAWSALLWLVTWVLLEARVPWRGLAPGALLSGFVLAVVSRVASAVMPQALQTSQDRYGAIGVAFTYIALLYVVSLIIVGGAVLGRALVTDESPLGAWLRGDATLPDQLDEDVDERVTRPGG
ncbi:MAG: YhjD/YihY/BrkB family envelope integrity protein [Candidatus Nanopelagicales bacterium]